MNKHLFAFYYEPLDHMVVRIDSTFTIMDSALVHRMGHVLRLVAGQACMLFSKKQVCHVQLQENAKVTVCKVQKVEQPQVAITLLLPVLKRDALEQAVYNATELGASAIQLMVTQKIDRQWVGDKELARLKKIVIAAAEQSKNFAFPEIKKPIAWSEAMSPFSQGCEKSGRVYGSLLGSPLLTILGDISKNSSHLFLTVGPEAGFTHAEEQDLQRAHFVPCVLGATTMRAVQAATVMLGVTRLYFLR